MNKKRKGLSNENTDSWIERNRIKWEIFLLLLGVVLGFFITVVYDTYQMHQEDVATAQSIYDELSSPKNLVPVMASYYLNYTGGPLGVSGDSSFTPHSSIFPVVRTKIGRFPNSLADNITGYDADLEFAEQYRIDLIELSKTERLQSDSISCYDQSLRNNSANITMKMIEHVFNCYYQIPIIKKQLHDNYGVN